MPDFVHLVGAEKVNNAAASMRQSADRIMTAAQLVSEVLDRWRRDMEGFVQRIEEASHE